MIIALAVCIPVLILAVVAGIAVYIYKKPSSKTGVCVWLSVCRGVYTWVSGEREGGGRER